MKLINVANVFLLSLTNILSRGAFAQSHCKDGEIEHRDNLRNQTWCFVYEKGKPETYANANMYCQNKGMTVSPARHLKPYSNQLYFPGFTPKNVWIGIRRESGYWYHTEEEEEDIRWYWSDGVRADLDWSSWYPLNKHRSEPNSRWRCALLNYVNRWVFKHCGEKHDFVCEYKLCPDTWKYNPYTGRCVKYFNEFKTFKEATTFCSEQHKAIVEVIRSPRASLYIKNTILPRRHHHPALTLRNDHVNIIEALWLGMTDDAKEGEWVWNDGVTVLWSNWGPDSHRERTNCATMATGDEQSLWTERSCVNGRAPFVCAKIECTWPWTLYANDTCYAEFSLWYQNARQANERCDRFGGKLAAPKTESQNEIVKSLFFDKNPLSKYAWLGLSGLSNNDWMWNDVWPVTWTNWDPNLNRVGYDRGCSVMSKHGTWIKAQCNKQSDGTICEKPAPWKLVDCRTIPHYQGNAHIWQVRTMNHSIGTKSTCFLPYKRKLKFSEAYRKCSFYGGFIAMPNSLDQEKHLLEIASLYWFRPYQIWIGADDNAYNRSFISNDGTPFSGRWFEDRDRHYLRSDPEDHCVHLQVEGNHIGSCSNMAINFFCQVPTLEHTRVRRSWEFRTSCSTDQNPWDSWELHSNKCFRQHSTETTFNKAEESCKIEHSTLALPKSRNLYRALVLADHRHMLWRSNLWIGLHFELDRGIWSDNSKLQIHEIDLFNSLSGRDTCVKIVNRKVPRARWVNSNCQSNHSFICQRAALQPIDDYDQYETPSPQCGKRIDLDTKRPIDTRKKRRSLNTGNIFAGVPTSIDKFPWFVHLFINTDAYTDANVLKCGGSIIADKYILTAAHCVHGHVIGDGTELGIVIAGETHLTPYNQTSIYEIAEIAIHPGYTGYTSIAKLWNDIAVLKLKRPLNLTSPYTRNVCLPLQGTEIDWDHYRNFTDNSKTGRTCFVAGMGAGSMSERSPDDFWYSKGIRTLSGGNIKLVEWWQCREDEKLLKANEEFSICSKITNSSGARPCHGDSGSPVVCREDGGVFTQYGVLSAIKGQSCGSYRNNLHVSVKVSHYSDWINEQIIRLSIISTSSESVALNVLHSLWVTLAVSCSWVTFV